MYFGEFALSQLAERYLRTHPRVELKSEGGQYGKPTEAMIAQMHRGEGMFKF